jgi:hypothetical protein
VHGDRGDIVLGWLTKVCLVLGIVGVLAFDGISLATANISATDTATSAANVGAETWHDTHGNMQKAYAAALRYAEKQGGSIEPKEFVVNDDGSVEVTFRKEASSVLLYRTKATKRWTHIAAHGRGRTV